MTRSRGLLSGSVTSGLVRGLVLSAVLGLLASVAAPEGAALAGERELDVLVKDLDSADVGVREAAVTALVAFFEGGGGRSMHAESQAAILVRIEDPRAMRLLVGLFRETKGAPPHEFVSALSRARGVALRAVAEPVCLDALADPDANVRAGAVQMLGHMKTARAVDRLVELLRDADPKFRQRAAWSLGQIADPRTADALLVLARDRSQPLDVRVDAFMSLRALRVPRVDAAVNEIVMSKGEDPEIRAMFRPPPARGPLDDKALAAALAGLRDPSPDVRGLTLLRLRNAKDARIVGALVELIRTDPEKERRAAAARILVDMKEVVELEPFLALLRNPDETPANRTFAISMLGKLAREEAVAPLTALLADPKQDMQAKGEALRAISKIKKLDDAALLLFLLDRGEPALTKLVEDALKNVARREFDGDAAAIRAWIRSNPEAVRKM